MYVDPCSFLPPISAHTPNQTTSLPRPTDVLLDDLLSFPRMKEIGCDIDALRRAARFSPQLVLSADGLRAKPRWSLAEWTKERIKYSKLRLKFLPLDATEAQVLEWLKSIEVVAHRICIYRDKHGAFNGSANFVADSRAEAERLHNKYKDKKPLWKGIEILLELEHAHAKSVPDPQAALTPSNALNPSSSDELTLAHHRFLEDCKLRLLSEHWKNITFELQSISPQGPFKYTAKILADPSLPNLQPTELSGPVRPNKKLAQRLTEIRAALYLFPIIHPNLQNLIPTSISQLSTSERTESDDVLLVRFNRQAEAKRLQTIYREVTPYTMSSYLASEGPLISIIGRRREWTRSEAGAFAKILKTLPQTERDALAAFIKSRKLELNNRGFYDVVRMSIAPPVDEASDDQSETKVELIDDAEEPLDRSKLESLEIKIPATRLDLGVQDDADSMRVLWTTTTQLFVTFEELTPRVNVCWSRHNVKYQMRNVIKNVPTVMWLESDLGLANNETADSSPANFLDLFVPVDSAPRLNQQEHFQDHAVGATDFTPNSVMGQMTLIRVHFDLQTLNCDQRMNLMVLCKSLIEIGLLRTRCNTPTLKSSILPTIASSPSLQSPTCLPNRILLVRKKEEEYETPLRLVELDHWVRWKLACLVTQNKLRLSQVTSSVVELLLRYQKTSGFKVLERLEATGARLFDFEERLARELSGFPQCDAHLQGEHFALRENQALVAHVVVTPLEVRCEGPLLEVSNRLLRGYDALKERFVRLSFRACYSGGLTGASMRNVGKAAVRKRIGGSLGNGMQIAALYELFERPDAIYRSSLLQRTTPTLQSGNGLDSSNIALLHKDYSNFSRWEFLVASSSQLRTQKAWMYSTPSAAPLNFALPIQVSSIRDWLGNFDHIYNVAMFSARLGQGLSSTFKCFDVNPSWIRYVDEVKTQDGAYMFSDGCAAISPSIAQRAASALQLTTVPSAFQIRLAGIKGMVSVDPRLEGDVICVRPSMKKFEAPQHTAFEVVGWSRPLHARLNKQIIQILSALGLPDEKLIGVQKQAFEDIASAAFPSSFASPEDRTACVDKFEKRWKISVKPGSLEHSAVAMMRAGFDPQKEPYLKSILTSLGLRQLQDIHSMARIPIKNGRYAIGIMDEFGVLEPGQVYFKMSTSASSSQASSSEFVTHTGPLCISRSPCLHPGDARFVDAVDVPELAHLVDVIVFPQKGARPIPDECSGGDLDGDQYLILWGDDFMPPRRDTPAFNHETSADASKASKDDNEVYPLELVDFFVNYIFDDKLSSIADAHTYWADKSELGVFDPRCLKLAEAHGVAVDTPKTGKVVPQMDELRVPAWPDFMNVNKCGVYLSKKVLGSLFRRSSEEFATLASSSATSSSSSLDPSPFDSSMLYSGYETFIDLALKARDAYAAQLSTTMQLFRLQDEASAITGEPLYRFRSERREWESKKEGFESAHLNLRSRFRAQFDLDSQASSSSDAVQTEANQLKLASAWYAVTYDPRFKPSSGIVMHSFPWVVDDHMIAVKKSSFPSHATPIEHAKPVTPSETIIANDATLTSAVPVTC